MGLIWTRARSLGHPHEWDAFRKRHPEFLKHLPELEALINAVFVEQPSANTPDRRLVYLLGCLCWQDYREILLLCGNGYGIAAAKILRSLYEHAVTAHHIVRHPEDIDLFNDYIHVQNKKFLEYTKNVLTPEQFSQLVTDEQAKSVIKDYERVRSHFNRENSWSPMNLLDMARSDGTGLHIYYSACFANPAAHLHASPRGVYSRIVEDSGRVIFQAGSQPLEASESLKLATSIFLIALRASLNMFAPQLNYELSRLMGTMLTDWNQAQTA
jgi:hypothetical protein